MHMWHLTTNVHVAPHALLPVNLEVSLSTRSLRMAYHLGGCQAYRGYQLGGCQAMCNHTSHPRHFKVAKPCAIQPHIHVTKHPRHRTCTTSRATHLVHSSSSLIGARRRRACARDFRRTRHSDYLQRHAPSHHTKTAKKHNWWHMARAHV